MGRQINPPVISIMTELCKYLRQAVGTQSGLPNIFIAACANNIIPSCLGAGVCAPKQAICHTTNTMDRQQSKQL